MFTKLNHAGTMITGSLETNEGGLVYYGYDSNRGLLWLNRADKQYTPQDGIWKEAGTFIAETLNSQSDPEVYTEIDFENRSQDEILRDFEDDDISDRAEEFLQFGLEDVSDVF